MVSIKTFRQSLAAALPGLELRDNEPMARHTTFRVGGPVTLMALPKAVEELGPLSLCQAFALTKRRGMALAAT